MYSEKIQVKFEFGGDPKSNMAARQPSLIFVSTQYLKNSLRYWNEIWHADRFASKPLGFLLIIRSSLFNTPLKTISLVCHYCILPIKSINQPKPSPLWLRDLIEPFSYTAGAESVPLKRRLISRDLQQTTASNLFNQGDWPSCRELPWRECDRPKKDWPYQGHTRSVDKSRPAKPEVVVK